MIENACSMSEMQMNTEKTGEVPHSAFCIRIHILHSTRRRSADDLNLCMRYLIWPLVKFLVAFIIVQVIVAAMNWVERRLLGLMQARLGPNRVGQ